MNLKEYIKTQLQINDKNIYIYRLLLLLLIKKAFLSMFKIIDFLIFSSLKSCPLKR